jgi:hypothetical protein
MWQVLFTIVIQNRCLELAHTACKYVVVAVCAVLHWGQVTQAASALPLPHKVEFWQLHDCQLWCISFSKSEQACLDRLRHAHRRSSALMPASSRGQSTSTYGMVGSNCSLTLHMQHTAPGSMDTPLIAPSTLVPHASTDEHIQRYQQVGHCKHRLQLIACLAIYEQTFSGMNTQTQ